MKAVIFDMDGILINSEPFWRQAEQEVFGQLGISLTDSMCEEFMGRRIDEVVNFWFDRYSWSGKSPGDVIREILESVRKLVICSGECMPGVQSLLRSIQDRGIKIALATSSAPILIDAVVDKLEIRSYFNVLCSAVNEEFGKPDPAVYLTTAKRLGIEPGNCLVFEDSIAGVQAAINAGMITVAVPSKEFFEDHRFTDANLKIRSLNEFDFKRFFK